MQTSMLYTIGTALDRASAEGQPVELLVEGAWLTGRVLATDSQGVVLQDGSAHVVVRLDLIAVVRVQETLYDAPSEPDDEARPMPGPRQNALVPSVA